MSNLIGTNPDQVPVNGMLGTLAFQDAESVNVVALTAQTLTIAKAITAVGSNGAQTINAQAGSVNFAATATSLVVTNSLVTVNSIIVATVGTADNTLKSVVAVAVAGGFTLTGNTAATAATRVNFLVIN